MAAWDDDFEQRNIRLEDMIDDLTYDGTTDYDWSLTEGEQPHAQVRPGAGSSTTRGARRRGSPSVNDWFAPGGAEREIRSAALTRGNATPLSTSYGEAVGARGAEAGPAIHGRDCQAGKWERPLSERVERRSARPEPLSASALKGVRNGVFAGAAVWAVFFVVLYLGIHA